MALFIGAAVLPQPPAVTLLTQCVLLLLVRNDDGYCSTQVGVRRALWVGGVVCSQCASSAMRQAAGSP